MELDSGSQCLPNKRNAVSKSRYLYCELYVFAFGRVIVADAVVKSMPNFIPGRQDGNPVAVWFTIPIVFKLQSKQQPQNPE